MTLAKERRGIVFSGSGGEDASLRDLYDIAMEEMPSFLKIYGDLPPRIAIYRIYRNPRYREEVRRAAERFLDKRCKCS